MILTGDVAGNVPSDPNDIFVSIGAAQVDKHRESVDGVDQGVDEVGEDDEGDMHVLDLFPLEMKERLREGMFQ